MANTVTNTRILAGNKRTLQYITIASDGTEETDLVVYDSSAVATALGIANPLTCTINAIHYCSNSATGVVKLEFDATTDVLALAMPYGGDYLDKDFRPYGGLKNRAGTGITGDIVLTTTGLAAGDSIHMILDVRPD